MTTFPVPLAGSPAWQEIYPVPPLLRLETVGPWCPLDDHHLQVRLDGWGCPLCEAAWDFHGGSARWLQSADPVAPLVRWAPALVCVAGGLAGCAAAALGLVALLGALDERLVWWCSAVLAAAAVALAAGPWVAERLENRRYRHNRVLDVDGEVRDGH